MLALFALTQVVHAQAPLEVIPFKMVNGHIRIELSINDSKPYNFVFDSGAAANLLSEGVADELGLDLSGSTNIRGAAGSSEMKMAKGHSFRVGNTSFERQTFVVMNIDHLGEEGSKIDGVLGSTILFRYVVEIDYDRSEIKLFKRKGGPDTSGYQSFDIELAPLRIPVIKGTLELLNGESFTGNYLVDTGAALAIMFNSNLVKDEHLIEKMGEHYSYRSTSLSNSDDDEVSIVPEFTVFNHSFSRFEARLSQATSGVNSFEGFHGILGSHILKRFNTIFDYGNKKMYVRPNKSYSADFPLNYTGLTVQKVNGNYEVKTVINNSTAAEAGILAGDIIESLDNKKFETRSEFYDYFQSSKGEVAISLKRKGESLTIKVIPEPLLN